VNHDHLLLLSRRLRSFTAVAFVELAKPSNVGVMKSGAIVTYLAVHHHGDLMLHDPAGYRHASPADVAQLTGLHESTVGEHLAALARRGLLVRIAISVRRVGYRPVAQAEEWLA
jgi:DNA-binding transcriptional ArsR family regulator